MSEALAVFVPLFGFMLLPVWIPILGVTIGWVADQFGGRSEHEALVTRLAAVKERSRANHTQAAPAIVAADAA